MHPTAAHSRWLSRHSRCAFTHARLSLRCCCAAHNHYCGKNGFYGCDIDLFLVGHASPEAAFAKLRYLLDHIRKCTGGRGDILVSNGARSAARRSARVCGLKSRLPAAIIAES